MTNKAIGYARVSREEEAIEGYSIDNQIKRIQEWAKRENLDLVDVIVDRGLSAKSLKRPGLTKCLELLSNGDAEALVIFKLDRLTRNLGDWQYLVSEFFEGKNSKALHSVNEKIDTASASGRMFLNVMLTVAQWEVETISERTKVAMAHKKSIGEHCGQAGYGFKIVDKVLVADEFEAKVSRLIGKLSEKGSTLQATANKLNALGHVTKRGKSWTPIAVSRVLKSTELRKISITTKSSI